MPGKSTSEHLIRLEKLQNRVLKILIPCPKSTPPALIRLLTGITPILGRVDMLKMRYFWRSIHQEETHLSEQICERNRQAKLGFVHEVFKLCGKYNHMNVWLGFKTPKVNPVREIRRVVEKFHYKKDLEKYSLTNCLYTTLFIKNRTDGHRQYKINLS